MGFLGGALSPEAVLGDSCDEGRDRDDVYRGGVGDVFSALDDLRQAVAAKQENLQFRLQF